MLTTTFIHAPGIGGVTERSIWSQGVTCWNDYLERVDEIKIADRHRPILDQTLADSINALEGGDASYFAQKLAQREHWRAVKDFPKFAYLDIETDGGMDADGLTIIGLSDGYETRVYTKGIDLAQFAYECQDYDGFVTFFGAGFDLPFLKRRFPVLERVFADRFHIDLCPLLKTLGYGGGLKSIERQLKINRKPECDGLNGMDAVRLWRIYERGGDDADDALRLLHAYNVEDVVNMKALLDFAIPRMQMRAGMPTPRIADEYEQLSISY